MLPEERYRQKISIINGQDPYDVKLSNMIDDFPNLQWGDIINYLVFGRSAYTLQEFKAFKSLEAYNHFVCGWVKAVEVGKINGWSVIRGKVCIFICFDVINFL